MLKISALSVNTINSKPQPASIITIGTFDGVHIGHQKIIQRLVSIGKEKDLKSTVLTFFPHPRTILQPGFDIKLLHAIDERKKVLSQFGLDDVVIKEFTVEFANLSAEDYVKNILVEELNAKYIIIGYDHHFGKSRSADIEDLKIYGKKYDFVVEEISAQDVKDVAVSSTKIRKSLLAGDIETANSYLGYPYFLTGKVVKGRGIGKTLDFPTANIAIPNVYKLIPKDGVYVIKSVIDGGPVFGMMNIGKNPTFEGKMQSIEVHFFDFNKSLYDDTLTVEILHHLRDEYKFETIELLKEQLQVDRKNSIKYIAEYYE